MTRQPDAGESVAAIRQRADDTAWPEVLEALKAGATLVRPVRLRDYYVDRGNGPGHGMLSAARVGKLERDGTIRRVGVDRYAWSGGTV
jgi:hypothetical protein